MTVSVFGVLTTLLCGVLAVATTAALAPADVAVEAADEADAGPRLSLVSLPEHFDRGAVLFEGERLGQASPEIGREDAIALLRARLLDEELQQERPTVQVHVEPGVPEAIVARALRTLVRAGLPFEVQPLEPAAR